MNEKLILAKKFLYKFFVIGFLFFIISVVSYIFLKDFATEMAQVWYGVDPDFYRNFVFILLGCLKVILIFFVLSPALALHWLTGCCKKAD